MVQVMGLNQKVLIEGEDCIKARKKLDYRGFPIHPAIWASKLKLLPPQKFAHPAEYLAESTLHE